MISGGLLTATCASATTRTHVMAKSALTDMLGSTNMGGFFAPELAWAGFHHLVIKGKADKPVYLFIHNGEIEIRDAENIWGKSVTETQWAIREELHDPEVKSLVIGPAGENLVRWANVMTGIKNSGGRKRNGLHHGFQESQSGCRSRDYGRCHCASRGSSRIQQEVHRPDYEFQSQPDHGNDRNAVHLGRDQLLGRRPHPQFPISTSANIPTTSSRKGLMRLPLETVGENHMAACFACQVHCRGKHRLPSGPYKGKYSEGPEYTSQGAFGAEPDCKHADTVLTCNYLVNQYGMDTLETGSMISWAMELYELGILTKEQTDGIDLRFGNDEALIEMIDRICYRKGWLANTLADGGLPAAEKIGKNAFDYLIQVKGMHNLHSDERGTPALALNIATASRGSDHLRSRPAIDLYHLPEPVLSKIYSSPVPYDGPLSSEQTSYEGKPWQVFWHENCYMAVDMLGICKYHTVFLGATHPNFEDWSRVVRLNTGLDYSPLHIWEAAVRANMVERLFNLREGMTRYDLKKGEMLNHRYFDEPLRRGAPGVVGMKIDKKKFIKMVDEFYTIQRPRRERRPET